MRKALLARVRSIEGRSLLSDPDRFVPLGEWRDFETKLSLVFGGAEPVEHMAPPTRREFERECERALDVAYAEPETTP
jgi:hypothetical protein